MAHRLRVKASQADIDRYAEFKAKRQKQKQLNQERLRKEFPLLFERDQKELKKKHNNATLRVASNKATPLKSRVKAKENSANSYSAKKKTEKNDLKPSVLNSKSLDATTVTTADPSFDTEVPQTAAMEKLEAIDLKNHTVSGEDEIKESVQDVLDYMLENNEVDETIHQRLSKQSFSSKSLKRLSTCANEIESISTDAIEQEVRKSLLSADKENEHFNDSEVGEIDVLNALRTVISVQHKDIPLLISANMPSGDVKLSPTNSTEIAECRSNRTSDASVQEKPAQSEIENSHVPKDIRPRHSSTVTRSTERVQRDDLDEEEEDEDVEPKCPNSRIPFANIAGVNDPVSIEVIKRQSSSSTNESGSVRNSLESLNSSSTVDSTMSSAVHLAESTSKKVVTYPQTTLFSGAMKQGRVSAELTDRIDFGNHFKYLIRVQVLDGPGIDDKSSTVRVLMMKRYSEFKSLRLALLEALAAQHCIRDGAEEDDKEHCRRDSERLSYESTFRPSDTFGDVASCGLRSSRVSELIPPLPSRQVMSLGMDMKDDAYQVARQTFLNKWLQLVLSHQAGESDEYRTILRKFLTC